MPEQKLQLLTETRALANVGIEQVLLNVEYHRHLCSNIEKVSNMLPTVEKIIKRKKIGKLPG